MFYYLFIMNNLSKIEENILDSIYIASENDPNLPEFPADNPKFPATPTYKIEIEWFDNIWFKDESFNPTWTHKDRMAWEIVVTYREFLLAKKRGQFKWALPSMSIISSGSAAIAIQIQLSKYRLPNLKVLIDSNIEKEISSTLIDLWCEVYKTDLTKKRLDWQDILKLTNNIWGFDITSSDALSPTTVFYDWLSYEIINNSPDYCFIPFGTGNLYENILNINRYEVTISNPDPRFSWNIEKLRKCNFMWATTNDPDSKAASKLYSPHLPFVHFWDQWIWLFRYSWFCWNKSDVYVIQEKYLDEAIKYAELNNINFEPSWLAWLALFFQTKKDIPRDKKVLIVSTGKCRMN